MTGMINNVQLIGNLGADPELFVSENGKISCRLSVAINDFYKDGRGKPMRKTNWMQVKAWGSLAEAMVAELHKGSRVAVNGRLVNRVTKGKGGEKIQKTEIQAVKFTKISYQDKRDELPF